MEVELRIKRKELLNMLINFRSFTKEEIAFWEKFEKNEEEREEKEKEEDKDGN